MWREGAAQHVAFGGGCACGADGVVIQLADFEQDIADYLLADAERNAREDVVGLLHEEARRENGRWSLEDLLVAMETSREESEAHRFILSRLGRSLESFVRRHQFTASAL